MAYRTQAFQREVAAHGHPPHQHRRGARGRRRPACRPSGVWRGIEEEVTEDAPADQTRRR